MDRMPRAAEGAEPGVSWLRRYRFAPQPIRFTSVQWLIAQLVACGLSDKEIAHMLAISASTVKAHNSKTMHTLGLSRRGQLVRYIFETSQFAPERAEAMLSQRQARMAAAAAASAAPSPDPAR